MLRRHEISDGGFERVKHMLPGQPGDPGVTVSEEDNRRFLNAVLWVAKTGAPWRDLPERLGNFSTVFQRFSRRSRKGVWQRVFEALGEDADTEWLTADSTVVRAHQHGAGKKGAKRARPSDAVAAASAPRSTSPSTPSGTPSASN